MDGLTFGASRSYGPKSPSELSAIEGEHVKKADKQGGATTKSYI
jgi:hypothetical protein